jgi:hypothetical protein
MSFNRNMLQAHSDTSTHRELFFSLGQNYAQLNRDEWEREGATIVEEYKEKYYAQYPDHRNLP